MATQILRRGAARRQLLARKEGRWAGPGSQVLGCRIPEPPRTQQLLPTPGGGGGGGESRSGTGSPPEAGA